MLEKSCKANRTSNSPSAGANKRARSSQWCTSGNPITWWTSDLRRARQTASLIGYPDATVDARWREADLGEWTSKSVVDLMAADAVQYQRWRDGVCAPPSGESIPSFRARVASAIEAVKPRKGNVLVVTHGGVIRAVFATDDRARSRKNCRRRTWQYDGDKL